MIEIVLRSGQVLINDPALGFNSNSVAAIKESLAEYGEYLLYFKGGKANIPAKEIVEIRET